MMYAGSCVILNDDDSNVGDDNVSECFVDVVCRSVSAVTVDRLLSKERELRSVEKELGEQLSLVQCQSDDQLQHFSEELTSLQRQSNDQLQHSRQQHRLTVAKVPDITHCSGYFRFLFYCFVFKLMPA